MITGEIKNKIDAIWSTFWESAGITNPMDVLSQMTYLFFMKMLDDAQIKKEATVNAFGGGTIPDATFPDGDWTHPDSTEERPIRVPYRNLRWHVFSKLSSENMFDMVRNNVFPFIKTLGHGSGSAYSRYMADAVFLIQRPKALHRIVQQIGDLNMEDRDTMGDVYEYILGKMAASGQNGQFRTPRHIIRMMVELMQPSIAKRDRVCDPAMGSAGFIVESARYVGEHEKTLLVNADRIAYYKNEMFTGYDTDATMLRIGAMNMMLHKVDSPNIEGRDSLSDENSDAERYSLILANPPFTGSLDKDSVSKSLKVMVNSNKTELLFLALFVRMLETGGRCASIVPDGVLFGGSNAHKAIRKELVDNQRLQAVISMPSGVFKPYAGVSTAILIFTKTNAGGTDNVWFYDMHADGFSLDDKRNEIEQNDIPDIIERWRHLDAEVDRTRRDQSFLVPVEEIRNNDYDLSINKYKEIERVKVEYEAPQVIMQRVLDRQESIANKLNHINSLFGDE